MRAKQDGLMRAVAVTVGRCGPSVGPPDFAEARTQAILVLQVE